MTRRRSLPGASGVMVETDWTASPPCATGQPEHATYPAVVTSNKQTPPAVVATEGVRTPMHALHQQMKRRTAVRRYVAARAEGGGPRPPAADKSPAACPSGRQGLAGRLPIRIGDRPDQQRVGLAMFLRGHPPRVRHPRPLAKLPWTSTLIILRVIANDWVMANDLDDLDEAEATRSRRRAASWSSSTSGTRP
jgi:hypothetical protein